MCDEHKSSFKAISLINYDLDSIIIHTSFSLNLTQTIYCQSQQIHHAADECFENFLHTVFRRNGEVKTTTKIAFRLSKKKM